MASTWTQELKDKAIELYKEGNPTPANTLELCKEIAEQLGQTANGVRLVLTSAQVYVKQDSGAASGKTEKKESTTKKVSKDDLLEALRKLILSKGGEVDDDIISKFTGKAAAYLVEVFNK